MKKTALFATLLLGASIVYFYDEGWNATRVVEPTTPPRIKLESDRSAMPGTTTTDPGQDDPLVRLTGRATGLSEIYTTYYADVYKRVGVSGSDADALRDQLVLRELLIDKALRDYWSKNTVDIRIKMPDGSIDGYSVTDGTAQQLNSMRDTATAPVDEDIKKALGDERYAILQDSLNRISYLQSRLNIIQKLLPPDQQLTEYQGNLLLDSLAKATPGPEPVPWIYFTDSVLAEAQDYLDANQYQALLQFSRKEKIVVSIEETALAQWKASGRKDNMIQIGF